MYKLIHASDYTVYTVGVYASVEACVCDCKTRYGVNSLSFGQDDEGTLYTALYDDEGIVVLKLYEVDIAHAS